MGIRQKIAYSVFGILLSSISTTTFANIDQENRSWFGNTGAIADPVKDADGSGHWWWPTIPASNDNDQELWGNRGVVYSQYSPDRPGVIIACPGPPPPPPSGIICKFPIFNSVFFDFDSAILKPGGQKAIGRVAEQLKEHPKDLVTIEGHTCDMGPDEYNKQLSQRRADSVANELVNKGIAENRITSIGRGETMPAVKNNSRANRMKNRRVVFMFKIQ